MTWSRQGETDITRTPSTYFVAVYLCTVYLIVAVITRCRHSFPFRTQTPTTKL
jgi:hypothetical protein